MNVPPLPEAFTEPQPRQQPGHRRLGGTGAEDTIPGLHGPPFSFHFLRTGAYLVNYKPIGGFLPWVTYDGTIRISKEGANTTSSGDLYSRPPRVPSFGSPGTIRPGPVPSPANGIPILSQSTYRYYLRITNIIEFAALGNSFTLGFQMWAFETATNSFKPNAEGDFSAVMTWIAAPFGWPFPSDYLEGDVRNDATGAVVARLKMGRVSDFLRKISIEYDTVTDCGAPIENATHQTWQNLLGPIGYDVNVIPSQRNIPEPSGHQWSYADLHAAMLVHRDAVNLDQEWRYYFLCVRHIGPTPRGVMFDFPGVDSNSVPREGVGVAAKWVFPQPGGLEPDWGDEKGKVFDGAPDSYMRTALHEIGHAFGLPHHDQDNPPQPMDATYMCPSNSIAFAATAGTPFPRNVVWSHSVTNIKRLRHWSDVFIRPGGLSFGAASNFLPPITPTDTDIHIPDLKLEVEPLRSEMPLGAPVRVELALMLTGNAENPVQVPRDISLKSYFVEGSVKDPSGNVRTFSPLVRSAESTPMADLTKGQPVTASLTLMRGGQGALFPTVGVHEITVKVSWTVADGGKIAAQGKTTVLVTGTESPGHAAAAHKLLKNPNAYLVLVLGGDHLTDGVEAIEQALKDPTLAPHYANVQAKRLAQAFRNPKTGKVRAADTGGAKKVVDGIGQDKCVCSKKEKEKLKKLEVL